MGETTVQERMAALRTDDGLIDGAVAELDTKLAAWLAAMKERQAALPDDGARPSAAPPEDTSLGRPAAGGSDLGQDVAGRSASKLFRGQVPTATVVGYHRQASEAPAALPTDEAAAPEDEDDEVLLACLDAETASAIQVKRRLTGNKRSVRELLDEIRLEHPTAKQTDSERTRWWRRGNERHDR